MQDDCITDNGVVHSIASGDPGIESYGPKYFVTMRMVQLERAFLFNGCKN